MKGCIAKDESGNYLLVPARGTKVRLSSSDEVARHVGQQVKLGGAFVDADEPGGSPPAVGSQSSSKSSVVREFRVAKVDVISQSCSAPSTKKK